MQSPPKLEILGGDCTTKDVQTGVRVAVIDSDTDQSGFTWYKIATGENEQEGWIAAQLIQFDSDLSSAEGERRDGGR